MTEKLIVRPRRYQAPALRVKVFGNVGALNCADAACENYYYVAATVTRGDITAGATVYVSRDAGVSWTIGAQLPAYATMGTYDPQAIWDYTGGATSGVISGYANQLPAPVYPEIGYENTPIILHTYAGELSSVGDLSDPNVNSILLGEEQAQFATADLIGVNTYRVTDWIRGQNGVVPDHDELVEWVLLSGPGIGRVETTRAEIGQTHHIKVVPAGGSLDDVEEVLFVVPEADTAAAVAMWSLYGYGGTPTNTSVVMHVGDLPMEDQATQAGRVDALAFFFETINRSAQHNLGGALETLASGVGGGSNFTAGRGYLFLVANSITGGPLTVTLTGDTVDLVDGTVTPSDTEVLTIDIVSTNNTGTDALGNPLYEILDGYGTSKIFRGSVSVAVAGGTLSADVFQVSYSTNLGDLAGQIGAQRHSLDTAERIITLGAWFSTQSNRNNAGMAVNAYAFGREADGRFDLAPFASVILDTSDNGDIYFCSDYSRPRFISTTQAAGWFAQIFPDVGGGSDAFYDTTVELMIAEGLPALVGHGITVPRRMRSKRATISVTHDSLTPPGVWTATLQRKAAGSNAWRDAGTLDIHLA